MSEYRLPLLLIALGTIIAYVIVLDEVTPAKEGLRFAGMAIEVTLLWGLTTIVWMVVQRMRAKPALGHDEDRSQ
jgi:hypothetical protein